MKIEKRIMTFKVMLLSILLLFSVAINNANATEIDNTDNKSVDVNEVFVSEEVEKDVINANSMVIQQDSKGVSTRNSYGKYPTRKGVILVTPDKYKNLLPTGHAAIIYTSNSVVESLQNGVVVGKNNWNTSKNQTYGVTVSSTTTAQDKGAADCCFKKRGIKYNYNYLNINTRSKFYCSQLVWAAFKDNYGIDLNTTAYGIAIHPMELVNSSKTRLIYRKK